jgi:hypothetical protein
LSIFDESFGNIAGESYQHLEFYHYTRIWSDRMSASVKKEYQVLEEHILNTFNEAPSFTFNGNKYDIVKAAKPRPSRGECKTDCYVLGRNGSQEKELKISIKLSGKNEFQGNKLTPETAESYFGLDWKKIVEKATRNAKEVIESQTLIYRKKHVRIQADSITLGWKLEITDKYRPLSSPIPLTDSQIRDFVYKGTKLPQHQKDAYVNGVPVRDSGVAEYIIYSTKDRVRTVEDIMDQLYKIESAPLQNTYLIFTANNYRSRVHKWEGRRYLSVIVNWALENGQLVPSYDYSNPLAPNTETSLPRLLDCLAKLPTPHPTEIDDGLIIDSSLIYS